MTKSAVSKILQSARVAELRRDALEIAALVKLPPIVELPRGKRARLRLLRLLMRERNRNVRLIEKVIK